MTISSHQHRQRLRPALELVHRRRRPTDGRSERGPRKTRSCAYLPTALFLHTPLFFYYSPSPRTKRSHALTSSSFFYGTLTRYDLDFDPTLDTPWYTRSPVRSFSSHRSLPSANRVSGRGLLLRPQTITPSSLLPLLSLLVQSSNVNLRRAPLSPSTRAHLPACLPRLPRPPRLGGEGAGNPLCNNIKISRPLNTTKVRCSFLCPPLRLPCCFLSLYPLHFRVLRNARKALLTRDV